MLAILHILGEGGSHSLDKDAVTLATSSKVEPFLFIAIQRRDICALLANVKSVLPRGGGQDRRPSPGGCGSAG